MSDYTQTSNYALYKPTVDADDDVWGDHLNANADTLDQVLKGFDTRFATTYDIRSFGALCDGVTDDSAALNAAINAVCDLQTGGKIIIPEGRTIIGSAITAEIPAGVSMVIEGMGPTASELYFRNDTDGLSFKLLTDGTVWGGVNLLGFTLTTGATASTGTGINIYADPLATKMANSVMVFRDLEIRGNTTRTTQWLNSMVLDCVAGCSLDTIKMRGVDSVNTDRGDVLLTIIGRLITKFATSIYLVNSGLVGGSTGVLISGFVQGVFLTNTSVIGQYNSVQWDATAASGSNPAGTNYFAEELAVSNCSLNGVHRGVYCAKVNQCNISGTTILHFRPGGTLPDFAGIEFNSSAFNSIVGNNVVGAHIGTESGYLFTDCGNNANAVVGNITTNLSATGGVGINLVGTTQGALIIGNNLQGGTAAIAWDTAGNVILGNAWNGDSRALNTDQPMVFTAAKTTVGPRAGKARWFVGGDNTTEGTSYNTTASTTSGNILTFAAGTLGSVLVNDDVTGTNIPTATVVSAVNSAAGTVTLNASVTGTVASGAAIIFHTPNSDDGSDFEIVRSHDDGSLIDAALTIVRKTGLLILHIPPNAVNDAAAAALTPPVPLGGVYRNGSALMVRVV